MGGFLVCGSQVGGRDGGSFLYKPAGGVETETSAPSGYYRDFAVELEDVFEIVQLHVGFGGHGVRAFGWRILMTKKKGRRGYGRV